MPGTTVFPMTIDGYPCKSEDDLSDRISQSVVKHRIIGYSGMVLENMGTEERTIRINSLWSEDEYPAHAEWLKSYSNGTGPHELVHPIYGTIYGEITSVDVGHKYDDVDAVHIGIEFVQAGEPSFDISGAARSLSSTVAGSSQKVADESVAAVTNGMSAVSQSEYLSSERSIGLLSTIAAQGAVSVDSIVHDLLFPSTVPGKMVAQAFYAAGSLVVSRDQILAAPRAVISAFIARITGIISLLSGGMNAVLSLNRAAAFTVCQMSAVSIDYYRSMIQENGSGTVPTRSDVESVVTIMRSFCSPIIGADRGGTTALAELVMKLSDQALTVMALLGNERTVAVSVPTSIYLILLANRVNRSRAEAVCRLNGIENPNRVVGEIVIPAADW